ncbi:MAG: energy-coupling factor ABC transporter permease [Thermodesulfobacteriota bacterium]|nr:energy-coupling factor ABC transporter permease [Thermodesulfobacteriota bacterium]
MHIPGSMLGGGVCPVTATVSAIGVAAAAYFALRSQKKPAAARFGAITALIFAGQMMNFPISNGTSGHLLGGVLASVLMGTPFGVLSLSLVVAIQCIVFSDGGFVVLGANIFNMALIGAGLGGIIHSCLIKKSDSKPLNYVYIGIAAWVSVVLASVAVSFELAMSGTIEFFKVIASMTGTHLLIGLGEALITVGCCFLFATDRNAATKKWNVAAPLAASTVIALMLSPFASSFPDGLEWVAEKYRFLHESAPAFVSPLPDYTIPLLTNEILSTGLAGLIGVIITFCMAWIIGKSMNTSIRNPDLMDS